MTPTVVLLHGLARRRGSLAGLGRALQEAGFPVWSSDYPSRRSSIAAAAAVLADRIAADLGDRPISAVTHSLGGIVIRHMNDRRLNWQRIVMLAPPNRGSQVAATFGASPLFRWFYGPAGTELSSRVEPRWPPPPAPFAIIAGTRRRAVLNPTSWVSHRVFAPDESHDGTISVDETRLPGEAFFATVDATHTFIMNDPRTHALILGFLRGETRKGTGS